MALEIQRNLSAERLAPKARRLFEISSGKILSIEKSWRPSRGAPVFTAQGRYTARGWTEWTQGFQYGSAILQFDATGDEEFLELGRRKTIEIMAPHVSNVGVHDHGFNNISTYGNLWRLMREGRIPWNERENDFYELALKVSGAVQAARWTSLPDGKGYIYSFNGPHSLFVDTLRSLRSLAVAHQLGHVLMGERDMKISLLQRLLAHAETTARYNIFYGEGRDAFDVRGRVAHESIFNLNDGSYRCPNTQQGYSPFSTWTRGLAWALLGYAEQLEFLKTLEDTPSSRRKEAQTIKIPSQRRISEPRHIGSYNLHEARVTFLRAATAAADFYITNTCVDGIPMWDAGAPNLWRLGNYLSRRADPFNKWEPVDSSAAAIAAQGLVRLGNFLRSEGDRKQGMRYRQAGFTVAGTLFDELYLSNNSKHQGLVLHSIYHRPNDWDFIPRGQKVPNGESSMWGDYHARELALLILREAEHKPYPTFFAPPE